MSGIRISVNPPGIGEHWFIEVGKHQGYTLYAVKDHHKNILFYSAVRRGDRVHLIAPNLTELTIQIEEMTA